MRVLVVDDEAHIVELIKFNLEKEGYAVLTAFDGYTAVEKACAEGPDLIVLDIMLPGIDGFEVCRRLRAYPATASLPIIMLSARTGEQDKIKGLELGADDYVAKPFSPQELVARVKANLRRYTPPESLEETIRVGPLVLSPSDYVVFVHGVPQSLTPKEFELLKCLALNAGKVLKRDYLLDTVWGYEATLDTRTLDVHIRYLRQKIEEDPAQPAFIETVRGVGYRFKKQD